ncbi:MAG: hypothetical protein GXX91_01130 [Verrucomicrobiaceae bacterium]|nr:hypothetical protein [Verrucomicrobiaceae bacterium]
MLAQEMKEHFTFGSDIRLVADGHELDLHNNYDFQGVDYSVRDRSVILRWQRGGGDWVPKEIPSEVELRYDGVERFEFHRRDPEMPFTEDDCLASSGYWTDEDRGGGILVMPAAPEPGWLRAFQFQSGAVILIQAQEGHAAIKR